MNHLLIATGLWALVAFAVALSPKFGVHKFFALYVLIPSAIVILIALGYTYGAWAVFAALLCVASVLRWPFYYIGKFVISKVRGTEFEGPKIRNDK